MANRRVNLVRNVATDLSALMGDTGTAGHLVQNRSAYRIMLGAFPTSGANPTASDIANVGYELQPGDKMDLTAMNADEKWWVLAPSGSGRLTVGDSSP